VDGLDIAACTACLRIASAPAGEQKTGKGPIGQQEKACQAGRWGGQKAKVEGPAAEGPLQIGLAEQKGSRLLMGRAHAS